MMSLGSLVLLASAVSAVAAAGELKVFVLAGQSNMEGHAEVATVNKTTGLPKNVRGATATTRTTLNLPM